MNRIFGFYFLSFSGFHQVEKSFILLNEGTSNEDSDIKFKKFNFVIKFNAGMQISKFDNSKS